LVTSIAAAGRIAAGEVIPWSADWPKNAQEPALFFQLDYRGLSAEDEANVVAFLGTLTDGYTP